MGDRVRGLNTGLADASVLRFERAKRQLDALNQEVTSFFNVHNDIVLSESELNGDKVKFVWRLQSSPHVWWPVQVGEILYNLRTGLDYLAVAWGGKGFPIFASCEEYHELSREGIPRPRKGLDLTSGMPVAVCRAIEATQPFRVFPRAPKADPLWALQELRNRDAHAALNLVTFNAADVRYEMLEGELRYPILKRSEGSVAPNSEVAALRGVIVRPAPPNMTVRLYSTMSIAFAKGTPYEDRLAGQLLEDILKRVDRVMDNVRSVARLHRLI